MSQISTKTLLHGRIKIFSKWIAPDDQARAEIKAQADDIRKNITNKAVADGLIILSPPPGCGYSGSFAKRAGLIRFLRGGSYVEGQDVDIPFFINPKDKNGNDITELLQRFKGYADKSYPDTDKYLTKSSVNLYFKSTKISYDLVPLLSTGNPDAQILIRRDGERRQTSVKKHNEFVKSRNRKSNTMAGVVRFNECLRLVKWWRYFEQEKSGVFGNGENDEKVPSFLLDMLCAKAFDELGVQASYAETLHQWFGYLGHLIKSRTTICFDDYSGQKPDISGSIWYIADPVNPANNIVKKDWGNYHLDELAKWFEETHYELSRAIRYDDEGDDVASLESMSKIFGNPFKNNCK
jgi:hypothetical protein